MSTSRRHGREVRPRRRARRCGRRRRPAEASASRAAAADRSAPPARPAPCRAGRPVELRVRTPAAVLVHELPSSISWRRISSRKNGFPSARARICRRAWSRRPSTSSRCPTSSVAASSGERAEEDRRRSCGDRRPRYGACPSAAAVPDRRGGSAPATGRRAPRAGRGAPGRPSGCRRSPRRAGPVPRAPRAGCARPGRSSTRTAEGCRRANSSSPVSRPSVNASAAAVSPAVSAGTSGSSVVDERPTRSTATVAGSSSARPARRLQDLRERPVRDALAVGEATADDDPGRRRPTTAGRAARARAGSCRRPGSP